jgi:hypothetical protein
MFHAASVALVALQTLSASTRVPGNLVVDPGADAGGAGWTTSREGATIEVVDGDAVFVIRDRGSFQQVVPIPATAPGTHVVLLARASTERINRDGSITGLPYLYGLVMGIDRGRIIGYLQGQRMLSDAKQPNAWTTLSGMFPVPEGATAIALSLKLGERRGDPQNGSAARFDDVAMVLLPTEHDAREFLAKYHPPQPPRDE